MTGVETPVRARRLAERLAESAEHRPDVGPVLAWLEERRRASPFAVDEVALGDLRGWEVTSGGDLRHETGRFFTVQGLKVQTDHGPIGAWTQPILNQTDVAVLGIVAREIDGVLHFLMQAKMEPGNLNSVQLSPTVQATASNYLRVHRGAAARYVEYFVENRGRVLVDTLQSEQGAWFHRKRNRNIVIEVDGPIEPHADFVWLTLGQLDELLAVPHTVNMDARTVLSTLPRRTADADAIDDGARHPLGDVRAWLTTHKAAHLMAADFVPMDDVEHWAHRDGVIEHDEGRFFRIVGADVRAPTREVGRWCQPLLRPVGTGLAAFVLRRIDGVPHVLARADVRPGYRDTAEIGPTVQCQPDNHLHLPPDRRPALLDLVLSGRCPAVIDVEQSEEGGRFWAARTRYLIVEVPAGEDLAGGDLAGEVLAGDVLAGDVAVDDRADPSLDGPDDRFRWVTPAQLGALVGTSYQLDIEARSLLLHLDATAGTASP